MPNKITHPRDTAVRFARDSETGPHVEGSFETSGLSQSCSCCSILSTQTITFTLGSRDRPRSPDSVQYQPIRQQLGQSQRSQHSHHTLHTGRQVAQQMGRDTCQVHRVQDKKGPMVETANPHLVSITTLPAERKIIGLKAVIVLCLIFMDGPGGQPQHSLSAALANENPTIGGSFSPPIKTKDTRTFQRLQQRSIHLMGRKTRWNGEGGTLWLVLCEEL